MVRRRKKKNPATIFGILLLLIMFVYSGLQILESTVFVDKDMEENSYVSKTVVKDGVEYFPRQDITTFLVMGIDQEGPVRDSGSYNNDGAVDTVAVVIFDEKDESISILALNRDTMVEMPVLGLGGEVTGKTFAQLALSHTYGSGMQDSCENTKKTVEAMLNGISLDYYMAMNMDGIVVLNDSLGGVTVNVTDDFSSVDTTIKQGQITLKGEQAEAFVRSRREVGDELNLSRMERQKEFMRGLMTVVREQSDEDANFMIKTYEDIADYIVSDCSVKTMTSMLERYKECQMKEFVSPAGDNIKGEEFMEFYLDEEQMEDLVLRLFYAPK